MPHTSNSENSKRSKMLCAARLLSGTDTGYSSNESLEMAMRCSGLLLDILENRAMAREMAAFAHMPVSKVQTSAETLIDRLLFNHENNPYVTLAVPRHALPKEVTNRWKRLITLYHPDRYPNQNKYEERAKKINQAYAEIRMNERNARDETMRKLWRYHSYKNRKTHSFRGMRRLPVAIIAAAIVMAIISMLLFLSKMMSGYSAPRMGGEPKIALSAVASTVSPLHELRTSVVASVRSSCTFVSR